MISIGPDFEPLCIARRAVFRPSSWRKREEEVIRNGIAICLRIAVAVGVLSAPVSGTAAELKPEAAQGCDEYIRLTERRMTGELTPGGTFLHVDSLPEPRRSEAYARLQRGEVISERLRTEDPSGRSATPGALIHHWVGTVFVPGATLAQVLAVIRDYDRHAEYFKPDIMRSKTIEQRGDDFKIFYRLRKKKVLTIVLDADFDVHYHTLDATRAYSDSYSTRIAQVENAGSPNERQLSPGKDGGFLWRLDSYWRYFDSGRGVYIQCEAISLTRDIPEGLGWLIGPMVESVPKESLEFTLATTRTAVLRGRAVAGR